MDDHNIELEILRSSKERLWGERGRLCLEAAETFEKGRYPEALRICEEVLEGHPHSVNALDLAALIKIRLGDYAGALTVLKESCHRYPQRPEVAILLALCHLDTGALDEAWKALQKSVLMFSENSEHPIIVELIKEVQRRAEATDLRLTKIEELRKIPIHDQSDYLLSIVSDSVEARELGELLQSRCDRGMWFFSLRDFVSDSGFGDSPNLDKVCRETNIACRVVHIVPPVNRWFLQAPSKVSDALMALSSGGIMNSYGLMDEKDGAEFVQRLLAYLGEIREVFSNIECLPEFNGGGYSLFNDGGDQDLGRRVSFVQDSALLLVSSRAVVVMARLDDD